MVYPYNLTPEQEAERLARQLGSFGQVEAPMLRRSGLSPDARVLDVGCGGGASSLNLSHLASEVLGMEPDPGLCEVATSRATDRVRFVCRDVLADLSDLGRFDYVYARLVFWCIPLEDYARALANLRAVTRPGGVIAIHDGLTDAHYPHCPGLARAGEGFHKLFGPDFNLRKLYQLKQEYRRLGLEEVDMLPCAVRKQDVNWEAFGQGKGHRVYDSGYLNDDDVREVKQWARREDSIYIHYTFILHGRVPA